MRLPANLDERAVTTTAGEPWTYRQACQLAHLIYVRFGRDTASANAAWCNLHGNNSPEADYMLMVRKGAELAGDTNVQ